MNPLNTPKNQLNETSMLKQQLENQIARFKRTDPHVHV